MGLRPKALPESPRAARDTRAREDLFALASKPAPKAVAHKRHRLAAKAGAARSAEQDYFE
jgi:hypothetical protein